MATILVGGLLLGAGAVGIAGASAGIAAGAVAVRRNAQKKRMTKLRKKLFGEPIAELAPKYLSDGGIPLVLEITCRQLEENALTVEGLFRVPGSLNRIQILADAFRKGKSSTFPLDDACASCSHTFQAVKRLSLRSTLLWKISMT